MVGTKRDIITVLSERLIFVYLVIFPLGQLIRLRLDFYGVKVPIHPTDVIVGISIVLFLLSRSEKPKIFKHILSFLLVALFSLIFSLTQFNISQVAIGSLYLVRLSAYAFFFLLTWNIVTKGKHLKGTLFNGLIAVSIAVGIFGWIQYFWLPDLRSLRLLGWDDHLYRLTGTFLDPGFTGIILVLGALTSISKYLRGKDRKVILISAFLLISIIFTYSRASYIAMFSGLIALFILVKRDVKKVFFLVFLLFLLVLPFIPRQLSEGAQLERTHSIYAKITNYSQTLTIFKKSPLFGVGFNNICSFRVKYFGDLGYKSHSCSGSDSSLLLVLATTGVVGLLVFVNTSLQILRSVKRNLFGNTFLICSSALFIHSLFLNSLFYPWIMGWMGILLAIALGDRSKS